MGCSSMPALVSTSCAAVLDQFPLVAGKESHRDPHQLMQFCSLLGFFAPVQGQDAQIRSTAHMVLTADFLLLE